MVIPREPFDNTQGYSHERSRVGHRRDYTRAPHISKAYLLGLLYDASVRKTTYRIASKCNDFALTIKEGINLLGRKAWVYKEGKNRNLWIIEFSKSLLSNVKVLSLHDKIDFIRGFFDAEGGIAKSENVRFYLYFCQKDKKILDKIKGYLKELGIYSGVIHNPSVKADPNYFRFFINSRSYKDFARIIGSNHPEKALILRMKI